MAVDERAFSFWLLDVFADTAFWERLSDNLWLICLPGLFTTVRATFFFLFFFFFFFFEKTGIRQEIPLEIFLQTILLLFSGKNRDRLLISLARFSAW